MQQLRSDRADARDSLPGIQGRASVSCLRLLSEWFALDIESDVQNSREHCET
jgi:hypothetical protein